MASAISAENTPVMCGGRSKTRVRLARSLLLVAAWMAVAPGCGHTMDRGASGGQEAQRPTSTPYSGDLSIFEYPDRDKKLQIERVMDLLEIKPGKSVADIGAGSGWFTVRAARRVGTAGTVYSEDINPEAIKYIDQRAKKESLGNIKTVLGTPDDAKLPPGSVDALLMLKVYHEIAHPVAMMERVRGSLRPGARIGIIDKNGNGTDHGLARDIVVKEMGEAGYKLIAKYDFTKADGQDYFLIFSPVTAR